MVSALKNTRGWIGGALLALCFVPALAQETTPAIPPLMPYNDIGLYSVTWSGVPVGWLMMSAHETEGGYALQVATAAVGVLKPITKHRSTMATTGTKKDGVYLPRRFDTTFKLRGDTRIISLDFDAQGKLSAESNEPPEPEWKRPKVPDEIKKTDFFDPLTPFYAHRTQIDAALRDPSRKQFTLRYYDGRRMTDLHYLVAGRKDTDIHKKQVPVFHIIVTREPIAGYKDKELKEMQEKDLKLHLYLSTDGRLLPLKFIVDAAMGAFYAEYRQTCPTFEACRKLLK